MRFFHRRIDSKSSYPYGFVCFFIFLLLHHAIFFKDAFLPVSRMNGFTMAFMSSPVFLWVAPLVLLCVSNFFMMFAWYGHLKFSSKPLWAVILVSWGIAFFEYCLAVPANRIGYHVYSAAELKTIQEIITCISSY